MFEKALKEFIKDCVREVLNESVDSLGKAGEAIEQKAEAPAPKKPGRPAKTEPAPAPAPASTEVTLDDLRKKCAAVAEKLGAPDRVTKLLASYGGKIAGIPAEKRAEVMELLTALGETSTDEW
jgi:hypothetical protein